MKSKLLVPALVLLAALSAALVLRAADAGPRVIKIKAGEGNAMKFDVTTITAAPGESLKIVMTNATTLPKNVMGHNWLLLAKGTDPIAFATAGAGDAANDYIPAKMKDKVLVTSRMLGPNETAEIEFKAPAEPGDYPFLCTFPAHCIVGMKGMLVVKK